MNLTRYEAWIKERWADQMPEPAADGTPPRVPFPIVAGFGLAGEAGETVDFLKKHYRDGDFYRKQTLLEMGDTLHYLIVLAQSYGWTLETLANANVEKLVLRDKEGKT